MRPVLMSLLLSAAPMAVLAAPVETPAKVVSVTLFPEGAQVTRTVTVPGGEVLVPNLPDNTDPAQLRVSGVAVGAMTLIGARETADSPARDRVAELERALAEKTDAVAAIRAGAEAARARANLLRGASTQGADLPRLAQVVGDGVRDALQEALRIEAEARVAEAALKPDQQALDRARKDLAAQEKSDALLLRTDGAGELTITTFVADAGWTPSYDLALDSAAGALAIGRYVTVRQATGEDWTGVDVTLSTARPSGQTAPGDLWPELVSAGAPDDQRLMRMADAAAPKATMAEFAAPQMQGPVLVWHYPAPVDIRDGAEDLRLRLDTLSRPVTLRAEAVPMLDDTAYRVAEGTNGAEPLLPGPAALFVNGALVGQGALPFVAGGERLRLGMGPVEGLRLKRVVPEASAGGRGVIMKSNARVERAEITVENLTGQDWPLRLIDRVPYSEQDDLTVSFKADPTPTAKDWDDKRGLLAWEFDLPAGETRTVTLETSLSWPTGQVLR
ncbi:DUF4139 domain-containing protein [Paenirhodobacter sp.]|uniref:DUF4139 domain-containing protein n=1 Tax=Paenirhodobacter sp. TaxID=1965326 RepID=UPI003B3CDAC4